MIERKRAIAQKVAERLRKLQRSADDPKLAELIEAAATAAEAEARRLAGTDDEDEPQRPQ